MQALLTRFRELADDAGFWNQTLDGLAVLGAADVFRVYRLQRPVPELAIAADSFHVKPLLRILQSATVTRSCVSAVSRSKLFEGTRDALAESSSLTTCRAR